MVNYENLYIEGDNLEVLKQLQKTYYGKIKMIYIDPPYNTGNDFVYNDSFSNSLDNYKEQTNQAASSNPESNGRFHTDWLNMMYPRLLLAKNLLTDDGVIFISIDDNELNNLKKICDEIYGEINYRGLISRTTGTPTGQGNQKLVSELDYILLYSKSSDFMLNGLPFSSDDEKIYNLKDEFGKYLNRPLRKTGGEDRKEDRPSMFYPIISPEGTEIYPISPNGYDSRWRCGKEKYEQLLNEHRIEWRKIDGEWKVYQKFYLEGRTKQASNMWKNMEGNKKATQTVKQLLGSAVFDFPKPIEVVKQIIMIGANTNSTILDFFSGSATTAHAVMKLNAEDGGNRKFIMIQLPELCAETSEAYKAGYKNICKIGEERIRRAGEQIKADWEKEHPSDGLFGADEKFTTDIGFKVFKLDSSNLYEWDSSLKLNEKELVEKYEKVFKLERSNEDIIYEIMLKYGVFDKNVEEIKVNDKTMYRVGKRYMIICLESEITLEDIKVIGELSPKTVVFNENSFKGDNEKINALTNLKNVGVEDIKCI